MTQIIIGTTPTITYTFKVVPVSTITKAVLTVKERGVNIIEKDLSDATVGEDTLSWTLTQEETLSTLHLRQDIGEQDAHING